MCGVSPAMVNFGGDSIVKAGIPVWRLIKRHLIFYGPTWHCRQAGGTAWCKEHCIVRTKPFPFDVDDVRSDNFKIERFLDLTDLPYADDFRKALYVTLLGTGTLDLIDEDIESVITEIPKAWPLKMFRFYLRLPIDDIKVPENARVIFSADKDTGRKNIEWAIKSPSVSAIGVVKHEDNEILIYYLKSRIPEMLDCDTCIEMDCVRRSPGKKYLVHMNFKGDEE